MARYRKKPVVIEAALFDGDLVGEPDGFGKVRRESCPEWFPAVIRHVSTEAEISKLREGEVVLFGGDLNICTLEGVMKASPNDMIIRGVQGEIYPCKPEIFAETYEAIPLPSV